MLDLARLNGIRLHARPRSHRFIGSTFLRACYEPFGRVERVFEGLEKLPPTPVIVAMNHTDRYNYFPWQYHLYHHQNRFTATWVKGKYYENAAIGAFMEMTNNIPTTSRGYIIAKDYVLTVGQKPSPAQYEWLRRSVDAVMYGEPVPEQNVPIPDVLFARPRTILGVPWSPDMGSWQQGIAATFTAMMARFVEMNREARDLGLDIIVFPEGTRTRRISRGHTGIAQMALFLKMPIVPVGCSGCDVLYPGGNPVPRSGRVVYRVGDVIPVETLQQWSPVDAFTPFSPHDERRLRAPLQNLVDTVMDRINDLVDEPYRRGPGDDGRGTTLGVDRFI